MGRSSRGQDEGLSARPAEARVEALEPRQLLSTVPTGYSESPVASGLNSPLSMEFAPDGRLFVTEQAGAIRVIKNGTLLATPALNLTVNSDGERGVLSVAFDPNFASNSYIYVCYTATTPTIHNRISRFTVTGDTINAASETVLFDLDTQTAAFHMGGDLHFGSDGKLYTTTGENFDETNAQLLTNLKGKLLRLNPDGSIPTDNPFYNTLTGNNRAIYAYGLRNPFTFDIQPTTGKIFINDVGGGDWEEINQAVAGANYGWPDAEGASGNPAYTNPIFAYPHSGPAGTSGYAITGGAFYDPITSAEFPAALHGKYFFTDYVNGWIRVLDPATNTATPFATDVPAAVDLEVSPDGAIYYLNRGAGGATGGVFQIRYVAAPTIVTPPQSQSVQPGSAVTFSVTASGVGPLSYQWQRNGVNIAGANASTYTIASATVADNGAKFRVIVTDSLGNATLTNGASWVAGQSGSALGLDGVNDFARAGIDLNQWLGGTSTLTAWIKTTDVGTFFYESPGITGIEQSQGDNDIMWGWVDAAGKIGIHPGNALGGISAAPINNGQWRFVAFTRNAASGVIQVYVDGALSDSANSAPGVKTTAFYGIGMVDDTGGSPEHLNGALDDVRIYNRVLSAAELANAATLPTSGLVTRYTFDENAGVTAFNSVPAGNSATSAEATLTVASGSAPTPTIVTPVVGALYTAGETVNFSGSATDPEDGNLPAGAFTWRIGLYHDTHSHPAMSDLVGVTSGTFTIPTNVETSDNVWYRVFLTVKDSSNQSVTTFRDILPRKATVTVTSNLPGAALTLDGSPITGPTTFVGVAGVQRTLGAPATQTVNGITYSFTGWSDGGAATHAISTPLVDTTYTANYASSGIVYVSDLTPTEAFNGWGPFEKDKSNGEQGAGDGGPLTINGVTYAKGLGVHSYSEIKYSIAGLGYQTFVSDVGMDDEAAFYGDVVFQVWVDGVLASTSGPVSANSATQTLTVDVTGKNNVQLIVLDGGDNIWFDHADWADARFLTAAPTNAAPQATIVTPAVAAKYTAGTVLSFSGAGTDAEDGNLPASAYTWKIDLVHDDHAHTAMTPVSGITGGTFTIPNTGETSADVLYRITLTVTDSGGKSHTVTRDVLPNTATVTLASNIAGVQLLLDGASVPAPTSFVGVAGVLRTIAAPASQIIAGVTYNFTGWSDAGAASHTITTPGTNTAYTATYTAAPVVVSPVYLSDLTPTGTPINGWGAYEKDKSNGELGASDGVTIKLQNVTYAKGLGVHANSDLSFNLAGQYATFISDIGVDDEVASNGSVTFVVYLDGVQVYSSGNMTGATATKSIALNVAGKNTLRLVVTSGSSIAFDHADWAGARLLPPTAALPAGWNSSNIGSVGQTGSVGYASGSYVVGASGTDIGGTSDSFRYVYQQLSGNMQITARVTSLGRTNSGAKAGVMLRANLNANSVNAGMFLTPSSGLVYSRRTSTGGTTTAAASATSAFPYWVRIQRVGNTVTTFRSTNGTTWIQVGSNTVSLGTTIYVGLAVTSKNNAATTTAVFDNVSIVPL